MKAVPGALDHLRETLRVEIVCRDVFRYLYRRSKYFGSGNKRPDCWSRGRSTARILHCGTDYGNGGRLVGSFL